MILSEVLFFLSLISLIVILIIKINNVSELYSGQDTKTATLFWMVAILSYAINYVCFSENVTQTFFSLLNFMSVTLFQIISFLWIVEIIINLMGSVKDAGRDREKAR